MLEYDSNKNILYAFKNKLARPDLKAFPKGSYVYDSFLRYIEKESGKFREDVMQLFQQSMIDLLGTQSGISIVDCRVDMGTNGENYHGNTNVRVEVKFSIPSLGADSCGDWLSIMELPLVREDGIILHDKKEYSFIHMLEQEPAISYEANASTNKEAMLKIKSDIRTIQIVDKSNLAVILSDRKTQSGGQKSYNLICVMAAMLQAEGYEEEEELYEVWDQFANFTILNSVVDNDVPKANNTKLKMLCWLGGNNKISAAEYKDEVVSRLRLERITRSGVGDESYNNASVRVPINEMLSLDRAIGEVLAKDVESVLNPGLIIANRGETVSKNMIDRFNHEGVYCIYVETQTNVQGYFLMDKVFIDYVPAGTKIPSEYRYRFIDDLGSMYTSRDYVLQGDDTIILWERDPLTAETLDFIKSLGYIDQILISDKESNGKVKKFKFYDEIMSNRQFKLGDLPIDIQSKYDGYKLEDYFYMTKDLDFVPNNDSYTAYDFVAFLSFCTRLFEGKWIDRTVNSDVGFRKVVIPLMEQYHRAFRYACKEGLKIGSKKIKEMYRDTTTRPNFYMGNGSSPLENNFYNLTVQFWNYLSNNAKCLQLLSSDCIHNPVSYLSACTKVNVYTANKHSVVSSQRDIATGSYAKIDPYEIPQSHKMGTVYNSTVDVVIGADGTIRTKYYPVRTGRVCMNKIVELTSAEEESKVIADICSLDPGQNGEILNKADSVMCRVPASGNDVEKQSFGMRPVSDIEYVNIHANQPLSWASATIPFMSSNDAARAIFAVAQEKAVKGLVYAEEPDVMTSAWEQIPRQNNKFCYIARQDGWVDDIKVVGVHAEIHLQIHYGPIQDEMQAHLAGYTGDVIKMPSYFDSGYSVTKMIVNVEKGMQFHEGDVLIYSNFVSANGIMTLGCNVLVAYICDGYNYEDGFHLSEHASERLCSYKMNHQKFEGSVKDNRYDVHPEHGRYYSADEHDDISVSKKRSKDATDQKWRENLKKVHGFYETQTAIKPDKKKNIYGREVFFVSSDHFNSADKASNRHGNKGVASYRIEKTSQMPRLANGLPLDICYNPLGVGSRMNIGQIRESHCGLCAHVLGIRISTDAYNCISEMEIRQLMSMTVDIMNSTSDSELENIISEYKKLGMIPAGLDDHIRANIDNIRGYANCFDKDGCATLMLPSNDHKMTETKVLIGYMYVYNLIQQSSTKMHARAGETAGEAYSQKTDAPTHGSSLGGGQRFGTMEIDALCAYGTSRYIQEITNERCDNAIARSNMYLDAFTPRSTKEKLSKRMSERGQRRSVTEYIYSMLALGVKMEPDDDEFLEPTYTDCTKLASVKTKIIKNFGDINTDRKDGDKPVGYNEEMTTPIIDGSNVYTQAIDDAMHGKLNTSGGEDDAGSSTDSTAMSIFGNRI